MIPWECGREGDSRYHRTFAATRVAASFGPMTEAGRRGIGPPRRRPFLPAAQEGLHLGARDRLPSYRRFSLLA